MTQRVLLLRALGLGDFLTGVPAYRAVRRAFPRHRIVLAAPWQFTELMPLTGAIDQVLPTGELEPVRWTGRPPDAGIDLHGRGPASHRLVAATRPGRLIVFGGEHGGGFRGPQWRAGEHEVARWCRLCTESGIPADPADLLLAALLAPHEDGQPRDPAPGPRPALVHVGAAAASRRWPVDRFAQVARFLHGQGYRVRLTGSAAERGLAERAAHLAGLPAGSVVAGRTSLAGLARLVASACLVVSGDTGVAHLASGYARPSVTLFGPVPPSEWGPPRHRRHQVLWHAAPGYRGDPHGAVPDPALTAIGVPDVLAAIGRSLRGARPGGHMAAG